MVRIFSLSVLFIFVSLVSLKTFNKNRNTLMTPATRNPNGQITLFPTQPLLVLKTLPTQKTLSNNGYHVFQTFNNCGPASLSMALSFYGINISQSVLGEDLRPYQKSNGDNDDKSVTLKELARKGEKFGFISYHRPNGSPEIIKNFINYDIPVLTRTITKVGEDIGHFRVIKGYNDTTGVFIQDDSLQGKNLKYTYNNFDNLWKVFGYEYLVLVPKEKAEIAKVILGKNFDETLAWNKAVEYARVHLEENPNDVNARFNLSVALYHSGNFNESVGEFEKIENSLPFRTLWYQTEPIEAYYQLKNYSRVFQITDTVLKNENKAFSELYVLRGKSFEEQGFPDLAKSEFEKAVLYNKSLREAQLLLNNI